MSDEQPVVDLSDLLRRLDGLVDVPPPDPAREAALLASFDAAWARIDRSSRDAARDRDTARRAEPSERDIASSRAESNHRRAGWTRYRAWAPIAVPLATAAAITWLWIQTRTEPAIEPSQSQTATLEPAMDPNAFVAWPGASALPAVESGVIVRMDLPAAMLPSLGLFPPSSDATVVTADVLVAQDGLARAVRLVP